MDAGEPASQSAHPCPIPKSLQPPEHDNQSSYLKQLPIIIPSLSRGLSIRLITCPVEVGFEVSLWQKRFAPKSLFQK